MKANRWVELVLISLLCADLISCRPASEKGSELPRSETLYLGGQQWGEPTSFNPLLDSASWPTKVPQSVILYETLLSFNPATGKMVPLLAESYTALDDGFEVTLHQEARWNDGKPVSAWDVKFSFELGAKYKNIDYVPGAWEYLQEIRLPETEKQTPPPPGVALGSNYPRKLRFILKKERNNPLVLMDYLQQVAILPRHSLEPMLQSVKGNISAFLKIKLDKNPVASGPYRLYSYSGEKIALVRNDSYWGNKVFFQGKKPGPKYVVHLIYKSNDHFSVGLQQGRLDVTSTFIPRIWLKHRKQVHSWFDAEPFYPAGSIPLFFINVTRSPLDDVRLRRAMAFAINYKDIRELAVSGYSLPLQAGLILPFGLEKKYFSAEDAKKYGTTFDPQRARALLREAGYRSVWDNKGNLLEMRNAKGQKVKTIHITSPAGWTDWESIVRIAVRSMRAVGIDARERFVDGNVYWPAVPSGDFDMIMYTPAPEATPSKPWSRFEYVLTSNGWAREGEKMYKNHGRFNNPQGPGYVARFDELLNQIPLIKDEKELTLAYRELNRLFMQHQPVLPLVYRPEQFIQYSTRHWQNFPNGKNPYGPAYLPTYRYGARTLWQLKALERQD
jgi:peptide/nickel transport system substrate-binding protein